MSSAQFHQTSPTTQDNFTLGSLKKLSHDMENISQTIIAYIGDGASDEQDEAKETFEFEGFWNLGNPENRLDLWRFFRLYNDAYFHGLLTDLCRIELIEESSAAKRNEGRTLVRSGFCEIFRPREERNPRYRIKDP